MWIIARRSKAAWKSLSHSASRTAPISSYWASGVRRITSAAGVSISGAKADHGSFHANSLSAKATPLRKAPSTRGPEHQSPQAPIFKSASNRYRSGSGSRGSA